MKSSGPSQADNAAVLLWRRLLEPAAAPLLEAAAECDTISAASLDRLRRQWPADLVAAAVELVRARRKAADKFPNASTLIADVVGVEQATSHLVAEHKARRFAAIGATDVIDLCCGIGGDAMNLARISQVTAFDRDPLKAWMTEQNARCETRIVDVTTIDCRRAVAHCDPSRRSARGRRHWRYEDYEPGPAFIEKLVLQSGAAAIKLGPGVDFDGLPNATEPEIELISEHGSLVQAVLWSGRLAIHHGQRTATMLPNEATLTGVPAPPPIGEMKAILLTVDPSVERAGLLNVLCDQLHVELIHPAAGLATSDKPISSPWVTSFELLAFMPWRPRRVQQWLREHRAGVVDVKTRGRVVDPDIVQRQLRGKGDEPFVVIILRLDRRVYALIARRLPNLAAE